MRSTWKALMLRLVALCVLPLFMVGCETGPNQDGHDGDVYLMVMRSADVTSVNVTGFGVVSNPTQFTEYFVDNEQATITWTSGASYAATVRLEPEPGKKADCDGDIIKSCQNGEDGSPRTYLLQFSGNTVTVSRLNAVQIGAAF